MGFRLFVENKDVDATIEKLPKVYKDMVSKYKISFEIGNCLKGDKGHVGYIDEDKKKIVIAAPWNYGREYTLLHEIGHLAWKYHVDKKMKSEWKSIIDKTKNKQDQIPEELFCMAFANHFANNKIEIHTHKDWDNFIKKVVN